MNRLYKKTFFSMAAMILLSFMILGGVFITLSYRFTMQEKSETMENDSRYVAQMVSNVTARGFDVYDESVKLTLTSVALISNTDVMLVSTDGRILYYTDGEEQSIYCDQTISDTVLQALEDDGSFSGGTNLGVYDERCYAAGSTINVNNIVLGYAIVSSHSAPMTDMWQSFIGIFGIVAIVVVCGAMVLSYISSIQLVKPLQEMNDAVSRFGRGEFDTRVTVPERKDEISELASAFNSMADSLALSETRRQEFVANISHELKTPMTTISGFTDGILDGTIPSERVPEYLQVVSSETKRLARLVRKMLDISRLQAPETITGHEKFDLCEIMCRMLLSLETKITDRGLDMDVQIPDEPVMVWGEPDSITQVGYNLMDNAIKFSPKGSVIGLSIVVKDKKAYVTIRNHGETIPPDELKLIFDRFHKSDKSRSIDKDGVGLGLYIVKTILNNHKEDITVTSENGITAFTFTMTVAS